MCLYVYVCCDVDLTIPREVEAADEDELAAMGDEEMKMRIDLVCILFQEGLVEIDNTARDDDEHDEEQADANEHDNADENDDADDNVDDDGGDNDQE